MNADKSNELVSDELHRALYELAVEDLAEQAVPNWRAGAQEPRSDEQTS